MRTAYLSLGSNLGDRLGNLLEAVRRLTAGASAQAGATGGAPARVELLQFSSVWETLPQGKTDQPDFLNMAIAVRTDLSPTALLDHALAVEAALGRVRLERWGPRLIDIDLCWYDDLSMESDRLVLPHPRMAERAFVLVPLLELCPDPQWQRWLDQLPDQGLRPFLSAADFQTRL
jgi:2-amino-4-hydroxy-6-hydroxymethyldihydropteridine diphosphokinase